MKSSLKLAGISLIVCIPLGGIANGTFQPSPDGPCLNSNFSKSDWDTQVAQAASRLKEKYYSAEPIEGGDNFNTAENFDEKVKGKIVWTIKPAKLAAESGVKDGKLVVINVNLSVIRDIGKNTCLLNCPQALGSFLDTVLEHEFHHFPASAGGNDVDGLPDADSTDPAPIEEVASLYASAIELCQKAADSKPEGNSDGEESVCLHSAACELYRQLKETITGKNNDGSESESSEGFAEEIKAYREKVQAHATDPENNPPPPELPDFGVETGGDGLPLLGPEPDCEVLMSDCGACNDQEDAGDEGSGSTSGDE